VDAWQELSASEEDVAWERVASAFGFPQRTAIRAPTPSRTWPIAHAFGDQRDHLEEDLDIKVLAAFRRCLRPDHKLYALDWQHPCYWFWPHRFTEAATWEAWKVPVLPDGDYYIFLAEDLAFGLFGHPWEQALCAFGDALLDALAVDPPLLLANSARWGDASIT